MSKHDLVATALHHLAEAGLEVVDRSGRDAHWRLSGTAGTELYEVQVKSRVSPGSGIDRPAEGRRLIITPYVSDAVADALRTQDVHYVDSAGNMYLRWDRLLVDIRGRHRPTSPRPGELDQPLRAFKSAGLKVLFALLSEPDMASLPYREIAHASGVSLGSVQWTLKELEANGYLHGDASDRKIHKARELLNRWVEAYTLNLEAKLALARFDAPNPRWWTDADKALRVDRAQWGGETAAHFLNPHLRPGGAVIYAPAMPRQTIIDHRLRKATGPGNVVVRKRFWNFGQESESLIVPTPLVYADLVASADPRQLEAATQLRDKDALLRRLDGR
jgi:hypothetical protein